jgi:hypothetical protein
MLALRETRRCPHCAKPLSPIRYGVPVSAFAARLIDIIERGGVVGVSNTDLFKAAYGGRDGASLDTMRSYISTLNCLLAHGGVAIRSNRHTYRIREIAIA